MKYYNVLFIVIFMFFLAINLQANNVVYIVVEGVSRDSLYSLIKKQKLPNYQKIISRGNYRNLEIKNNELKDNESTYVLYNGLRKDTYAENSFFQSIHQENPSINIKCFFTNPIAKSYNLNTEAMLTQHIKSTNSMPLKYSKSSDIGAYVADAIIKNDNPFFFVLNFTNVDYVGWRYREGAVLYSQALLNTDRAIGKIISALEEKEIFETTEFLITTNYGYHLKTQLRKAEGWVVSTQKALRKGSLNDIYPSLIDLLNLDNHDFSSYEGKSLFKLVKPGVVVGNK